MMNEKSGVTDWICPKCDVENDSFPPTDKCWKCGYEKQKEKSCWICRRTESEILQQAEEDRMGGYIGHPGDEVDFIKISGIYEKKYTKNICPVCYWILIKMTHQGIKEMIDTDTFKMVIDSEYP